MLFRAPFRRLVCPPLRHCYAARRLSLDASKRFECKIDFAGRCSLTLSRDSRASFYDGCVTATLGDSSVVAKVIGHSVTDSSPLAVCYSHARSRVPNDLKSLSIAEYEKLISCLIESSLRPLFPRPHRLDTQIMCTPLSVDGSYYLDVLSINAASAALALSDIPWNGPVGAVRMGQCSGNLIINPTYDELINGELNLVIVLAAQKLVVLLHGFVNKISKKDVFKAVKLGIEECQHIVSGISGLQKEFGNPKRKLDMMDPQNRNENLENAITRLSEVKLKEIFTNAIDDKISKNIEDVKTEVIESLKTKFDKLNLELCSVIFDKICKQIFRNYIYNCSTRYNVRKLKEFLNSSRLVYIEKPLHEEQKEKNKFYCNVTLDSLDHVPKFDLETFLDEFDGEYINRNYIRYELLSYAANNIGKMDSSTLSEIECKTSREEDLKSVYSKNLPFTTLQTSEVLESNDKPKVMIDKLLTDKSEPQFELGAIYKAKVVKIEANGVMIKLYPTMKPVLIQNYQLDSRKINHPSALDIKEGQEIQVQFLGRDPVSGIMKFSRRALQKSALSSVQNIGGKNAQ